MAGRAGRAVNKQPQGREAQKPKQKKSFQDECKDRIVQMHEAQRERAAKISQEKHREEEDEVMRMTYGPNWKSQEPSTEIRPSGVHLVRDDGDEYDDEVDLKAS